MQARTLEETVSKSFHKSGSAQLRVQLTLNVKPLAPQDPRFRALLDLLTQSLTVGSGDYPNDESPEGSRVMTEITRRPAIYVRVSTEEQAASGTSLRSQIRTLRDEIRNEGQSRPMLFVDDGYSGTLPHRPGLMELEAAISTGEVSEVRVTALDRLSRDLVLQETLLSRWAKLGVGFKSQREPDLAQADPTRVLIRQVLGAISQYERSVIAARMMAGRVARAQQGHWPGGKPAFGFVLSGHPPKAVIDPRRAALIREAGERVLNGERATWIAEDFTRRKIDGPGGKVWDGGYLSRMLRNPIYKGEGRYRVREFVEPKTRRKTEHAVNGTRNTAKLRSQEEWITFEVPTIFSDSEWAAIQTELGKRGSPKKEEETYLLSRRFESTCGAAFHGNRHNGKPRYLCSRRVNRKQTGDEDCGCSQIPASLVDEAVWAAVAEILSEPERIASIAAERLRLRGLDSGDSEAEKRLRGIDRKIVKEREALNRLIRFHAESGTLNDEDFERAVTDFRMYLEKLEDDRNQLLRSLPGEQTAHDQQLIAQIASDVANRLQNLKFEEKQRIIALLDVRVRAEEEGRFVASLSGSPESKSFEGT
jgi:site-specific DNA recombinase